MILRPYEGKSPRLGTRVFVAENAAVIGDVEIGNDCSIWYSTVVRGDVNFIRIGSRTNVQDNCTIHVDHGKHATIIAEEVTIGHGAVVHGCTVHRGALIGMGSRVLSGAVIGESALVGSGALVPEGMQVPPRTLVIGVPARIKRPSPKKSWRGSISPGATTSTTRKSISRHESHLRRHAPQRTGRSDRHPSRMGAEAARLR